MTSQQPYVPVTCEELACIPEGLTSLENVEHARVRVLGVVSSTPSRDSLLSELQNQVSKGKTGAQRSRVKPVLNESGRATHTVFLNSVGEPRDTTVKLDFR